VVATLDRDPELGTDRLASAILEFPAGHAIFTCSTQLIPYQRIHFLGTHGRIEIEIPFNAPIDRPTRLFFDSTGDLSGSGITTEIFPAGDQYTLQGDAFARAVFENREAPVTLEDSVGNMAVIEAIFHSAQSGQWASPQR
jgi:predicted dehydrogenase